MWCAILANRQIQLRDLHSVKDLSTNLNTHTHKDTLTHTHTKTLTHTYTQNQGLAEHPGCGLWWSSITPHRWIYFLPSIMLGVPDLAARQTWVQITALLLTSWWPCKDDLFSLCLNFLIYEINSNLHRIMFLWEFHEWMHVKILDGTWYLINVQHVLIVTSIGAPAPGWDGGGRQ